MDQVTLGIETSCDETAAAVYSSSKGVLSNVLFSQIDLHAAFGGVVPEIASRSHLEKIGPMCKAALENANVALKDINNIAVTSKPGLPGSLLVGLNFAKALAWTAHKKLIGVNHLEGHIFSACIEQDIPFPFICLTASGGHTALYYVEHFGTFTLLGQTLDDAAGEAFDKVAKLMNLPYPGGPIIEALAKEVGFQKYFDYPHPMKHSLDFSFSGLKTAVLYKLVEQGAYDLREKRFLKNDDHEFKQKVSSSLLVSMGDIFEQKLALALEKYSFKAIAFVGGVACNHYLRNRLSIFAERKGLSVYSPSKDYCTDNGAMIAFVGNYKALQQRYSPYSLDLFE